MSRTTSIVVIAILVAGYGHEPTLRTYNAGSVDTTADTPRFENLPVQEKFTGKPASVRLTSREARKYRTMIREGASEGPNFAGHYTLIQTYA